MKILLGVNTFGNNHRQTIAKNSWIHLRDNYNIDVIDMQFVDDVDNLQHTEIETKYVLHRSSKNTIEASNRQLPFVNDMFSYMSEQHYDYFMYCNNDIIVMKNIIKYLHDNKPNCVACSRVDIHDLKSFDDVLNKNIRPVRYEIAGLDLMVFKSDWYKSYSSLFDDYLAGQPQWDQVFASIMKIYGDKPKLGNMIPPFCFHIMHGQTWQTQGDSVERNHNEHLTKSNPFNALMFKLFNSYLLEILIKRQPSGLFLNPLKDEPVIEHTWWERMRVK